MMWTCGQWPPQRIPSKEQGRGRHGLPLPEVNWALFQHVPGAYGSAPTLPHPQGTPSRTLPHFIVYMCVCMHTRVRSWCVWVHERQRLPSGVSFLLSPWLPGIELRSAGFCAFTCWAISPYFLTSSVNILGQYTNYCVPAWHHHSYASLHFVLPNGLQAPALPPSHGPFLSLSTHCALP